MEKTYIFGWFSLFEIIVAFLDIVHICSGSIILSHTSFHEIPRAYVFISMHIALNTLWKIIILVRIVYFSCTDEKHEANGEYVVSVDDHLAWSRRDYFLAMRTLLGFAMIVYGIVTLSILSGYLGDKRPIIIFLIASFCYEVIKNFFHFVFLVAIVILSNIPIIK